MIATRPARVQWRNPSVHDRHPRVTVVIPCYNYGRFLASCVHSVLAQEHVDLEVLVMDDASTDDTPAVAAELARRHPRVKVVRHEHNHGHIATYNEGLLSLATGDYLVLLSADDMLTPGSLARATAVMEAHPQVGLVYGHPRVVRDDAVPPARVGGRGVLIWEGDAWIRAQCRRGLNSIYSPEACVRASVQRAVGGYNPELPHTGDLEMWLRCASVASVARVNSDQAYRRIHGASMMQTAHAGLLADLRGRSAAYETFFAGPGAGRTAARQDLASARRRLAGEALEYACAQLRSGSAGPAEVADYVAFAAAVQGEDESPSWLWREYRALAGGERRPAAPRAALLRYSAARRDLDNRVRWWRWRLAGV